MIKKLFLLTTFLFALVFTGQAQKRTSTQEEKLGTQIDPDLVLSDVVATMGNRVFQKPEGDISFVFSAHVLTYVARGNKDYVDILSALGEPRKSKYGPLKGIYIGKEYVAGRSVDPGRDPDPPRDFAIKEDKYRWQITNSISRAADYSEANSPEVYREVGYTWAEFLRMVMPYMGLVVILLCVLWLFHDGLGRELVKNLSWRNFGIGKGIFSFWVFVTAFYVIMLLLVGSGLVISAGLNFFEGYNSSANILFPAAQCIGITYLVGIGIDWLVSSDKYTTSVNQMWLAQASGHAKEDQH